MRKNPKLLLTLHRETLRALEASELREAQTGAAGLTGTETRSCPVSCVVECPLTGTP